MTTSDAAAPAARRPDAPLSRVRFWVAVVLCLAGIAMLLALGSWQVERLRWKTDLIATIDARIHASPRPLEDVLRLQAATGDVEYVPVTATGRFLHEGERHFLSTFDGQAGWNVYTPLLLSGGTQAVFVNRGFVPYALKDPAARMAGQVEGDVRVAGLARNDLAEKPAAFLPDNDPARNNFFWRNLADMGTGLALPVGATLLPILIDAGPGAAPGGWPVGGVTVVDIPNNHLQYAITWFGLALVLAAMLGALVWRGTQGALPPAPLPGA